MQLSADTVATVWLSSFEEQKVVLNMIKGELQRLGLGASHKQLVEYVLEHLEGIEYEWGETTPDIEILDFLKRFDSDESPEVLDLLFARQIAQLQAWYYRAVKNTPDGPVWWNPLEQSLHEFRQGDSTVQMYHDEQPYPPRDMVRAWSSHLLQRDGPINV